MNQNLIKEALERFENHFFGTDRSPHEDLSNESVRVDALERFLASELSKMYLQALDDVLQILPNENHTIRDMVGLDEEDRLTNKGYNEYRGKVLTAINKLKEQK